MPKLRRRTYAGRHPLKTVGQESDADASAVRGRRAKAARETVRAGGDPLDALASVIAPRSDVDYVQPTELHQLLAELPEIGKDETLEISRLVDPFVPWGDRGDSHRVERTLDDHVLMDIRERLRERRPADRIAFVLRELREARERFEAAQAYAANP